MKKLKTKNKKLLYKPTIRKRKEYSCKDFGENLITLIVAEKMNEYINEIHKLNIK